MNPIKKSKTLSTKKKLICFIKAGSMWLLYNVISSVGKTDKATDKKNAELAEQGIYKQAIANFDNRTAKLHYTYYEGNPAVAPKAHISWKSFFDKELQASTSL